MISLSTSMLIGFIFETLFYGAFLIIFGISVNLQWRRYRQESLTPSNKLVFFFSALLCLFITAHWLLNLWGIYDAFLRMPDASARELFLANSGTPTAITKLTIYGIQTWMGDAILIYRLYYVTCRRWAIVVPPIITCCGLIACNFHFLYNTSKIDFSQPQTLPAILSSTRKWAIATFALTAAENIYCLALIASFIWTAHRGVRHTTSSRLQSVLRVFTESAGIWVLFISITFVTYLFDENACYIPLYLTNPILGISFCVIIIRLQLREKITTIGSGNTKPSYLGNFNVATRERNSYTAGSENSPNELTVSSSKRTVDDPTFDTIASKV